MIESITNWLFGSKPYDPTPYREMIKYVLQVLASNPHPYSVKHAEFESTVDMWYKKAIGQKGITPDTAAEIVRGYTDSLAMIRFIDRSAYWRLDEAIDKAKLYENSILVDKYLDAINNVVSWAETVLETVPPTYWRFTDIRDNLKSTIKEWKDKEAEALKNKEALKIKHSTETPSPGFLKGCRLLKLDHDTIIIKLNPDCENVGDPFGVSQYRLSAGDYILKNDD